MPAKVIAGDVFHLVGFVEHHRRVLRQNAAEIVLLQRQVGEKKVMIHDDQVRIFRPLVHLRNETFVKLRAFLAGASVATGINAGPQIRVVGQKRKLGAISSFREFCPLADLAKRVDFLHAAQHRLIGHGMRLRQTKKIGSALHHRNFQVWREVFLQKRNIFLKKLFLQGFRGRRDHNAPPTTNCRE